MPNKQELNKIILCIVGPSGSGKSSLIKYLISTHSEIFQRYITITDRPVRESETQGDPYKFVTKDEFDQLIKSGDMLEYEEQEHNGRRYGKSKSILNELISNKILLTELQIYKIETLKQSLPDYFIYSCFMDVEDSHDMEQRLLNRGDNLETIKNRLSTMVNEGDINKDKADFIIPSIYGDLQTSGDKILEIVECDINIV